MAHNIEPDIRKSPVSPGVADTKKRCPECGSRIVEVTGAAIISNYPAPQLRMLKCSSNHCSYREYIKIEDFNV